VGTGLDRGAGWTARIGSLTTTSSSELDDDAALLAGGAGGALDAVKALVERHGALAQLSLLRTRSVPTEDALDGLLEGQLLGAPDALGSFAGGASLRAFLAAWLLRQERTSERRGARRAGGPEPAVTGGDTKAPGTLVAAAREALGRQPPNVMAMTRAKLGGLGCPDVAALLGASEAQVRSALERLAGRLAAALAAAGVDEDTGALGLRWLLDVASPAERLAASRRSEREPAFAERRAWLEAVAAELRDEPCATAEAPCPDPAAIAGYVDGTTRGAGRSRIEAHLTACSACLDEAGALFADLQTLPVAREAQAFDRGAQVAAMGLCRGVFEPATALADGIAARRHGRAQALAADLARLGRACRGLALGGIERDASGLVARDLPSDEEAALVAFEALAMDEPAAALRALAAARTRAPAAARLGLLAAAALGDTARAQPWAEDVLAGYDLDPGALVDAECVRALDPEEALPRPLVVERLRALVPDLVREVVMLHVRPAR
jgi:hypothetical protein